MLPNLKLLRAERGVSQQRLADALGISQQSINQYENHKVEPDIRVLSALADYFDTSIDYLVGRTDIRRRIEPTEPFALNRDEAALVCAFRSLTDRERGCVRTLLETLRER